MRGKNPALVSLVFMIVLSILITGPVMSSPDTLMYVDPPTKAAELDEVFSVNIMIADAPFCVYAWQARVKFDGGILEVLSVIEGPWLSSQSPQGTLWVAKIFQDEGYVDVACTAIGEFDGAGGSGTLFTINFLARDIGSTNLDLQNTILVKPLEPGKPPEEIPHTAEDGFVDVHSDWLLRPNFYVELVHKSVDNRHWDISVKGTEFTFYGKGKNRADEILYARILFDGMKDGEPFSVVTDSVALEPGENSPPFQTHTMWIDPSTDIGEYVLQVYAQFSYRGFKWYTDYHKVKDLTFVIQG